jgi:hypothetical protein
VRKPPIVRKPMQPLPSRRAEKPAISWFADRVTWPPPTAPIRARKGNGLANSRAFDRTRPKPCGQPRAAKAVEPLPEVATELVAEGLNATIFLVAPDDGSGRRFIGEQAGRHHHYRSRGKAPGDAFSRPAPQHGDAAQSLQRARLLS